MIDVRKVQPQKALSKLSPSKHIAVVFVKGISPFLLHSSRQPQGTLSAVTPKHCLLHTTSATCVGGRTYSEFGHVVGKKGLINLPIYQLSLILLTFAPGRSQCPPWMVHSSPVDDYGKPDFIKWEHVGLVVSSSLSRCVTLAATFTGGEGGVLAVDKSLLI